MLPTQRIYKITKNEPQVLYAFVILRCNTHGRMIATLETTLTFAVLDQSSALHVGKEHLTCV